MNEIRKNALYIIQAYCATYRVYVPAITPKEIYQVVDTDDRLAYAIVYAVSTNDYSWLKEYLKSAIDYHDTHDDLFQLASKIAYQI